MLRALRVLEDFKGGGHDEALAREVLTASRAPRALPQERQYIKDVEELKLEVMFMMKQAKVTKKKLVPLGSVLSENGRHGSAIGFGELVYLAEGGTHK